MPFGVLTAALLRAPSADERITRDGAVKVVRSATNLGGSKTETGLRKHYIPPRGIGLGGRPGPVSEGDSHVDGHQHNGRGTELEMASIETTTTLSMADAETAIRAALSEQGFGVLTEIDLAATLLAKLGVARPPMKILGACNPSFANRALEFDEDASLLLPCNVVLSETENGTRIAAIDPRTLMSDPEFAALAQEAADQLIAAIAAVPVT